MRVYAVSPRCSSPAPALAWAREWRRRLRQRRRLMCFPGLRWRSTLLAAVLREIPTFIDGSQGELQEPSLRRVWSVGVRAVRARGCGGSSLEGQSAGRSGSLLSSRTRRPRKQRAAVGVYYSQSPGRGLTAPVGRGGGRLGLHQQFADICRPSSSIENQAR
jgi:hypothetical protein